MVKAQKIRDGGVLSPKCHICIRSLHPKTQRTSHRRCQKDCKSQRQRRTSVKQFLFWAWMALTLRRSLKLWLPAWACTTFIKSYQILQMGRNSWAATFAGYYWPFMDNEGIGLVFLCQVWPLKVSQTLIDCSVSTCKSLSSLFCVKYAVFHLHVSLGCMCVCPS